MNTEKHVLVVTYYFPPSGGPGVQRVLKFVTYLRSFGWRPVILTVENADYPAIDESLLDEIPVDVPVHRTRIVEPYSVYRKLTGKKAGTPVDVNTIPKPGEKRSLLETLTEWIRATFFIPDARIGWLFPAVHAGEKLIHRYKVRAIYSSSPPYTCSVIARNLKRKTGLPWIAGFRDPWRGFLSAPDRWFLPDMIDRSLERSVFEECDRMEVAWKGIIKDFHSKYPDVSTDKVFHLPNGYDSTDFGSFQTIANNRFTLTYTGSMYGKRNPEALFAAVTQLVQEKRIEPEKIDLQFIGRFGADVQQMFEHPVLSSSITVHGYMAHAESVKHLIGSDALLLVVDEFRGNEEIVPGKVYEYMGSGKPVLGIAPEGAVAEVIRETGSGITVASDDIRGIADAFLRLYDAWESGTPVVRPDRAELRKYERKEVTRRLASLLDEVTD